MCWQILPYDLQMTTPNQSRLVSASMKTDLSSCMLVLSLSSSPLHKARFTYCPFLSHPSPFSPSPPSSFSLLILFSSLIVCYAALLNIEVCNLPKCIRVDERSLMAHEAHEPCSCSGSLPNSKTADYSFKNKT